MGHTMTLQLLLFVSPGSTALVSATDYEIIPAACYKFYPTEDAADEHIANCFSPKLQNKVKSLVMSGTCSQKAALEGGRAFCQEPACVSAVLLAVPELTDECLPADKFPKQNSANKCDVAHACDAGNSRFFESLTVTMANSKESSSNISKHGIFSISLAGIGGGIVGALFTMVMARMIRGGRVQQEPLLG